MQETTFPVAISIHDDASTDGTADIVRNYQTEYPHLIRSVLQHKNQYSQNGNAVLFEFLNSAQGSFVAYCEGDDYWTSKNKLELQLSYLRATPDAIISFHDVIRVDENGAQWSSSKIKDLIGQQQPKKLVNYKMISCALIPTLSIVYRKVPIKYGRRAKRLVIADCYLFARLSEFGEAHNIGVTMGAHRSHPGGIWTSQPDSKRSCLIRQMRLAIACEISPAFCLQAAEVLACSAFNDGKLAIRQKHFSIAVECLSYFAFSLLICFRAPKATIHDWFSIFCAVMYIAFIPIRHIANYLRCHARQHSFRRE